MGQGRQLGDEGAGFRARKAQAEQVLQLTGQDRHRDAAGETNGHGMWDVANQTAEAGEAEKRQHKAGQEHREHHAVDAKPGYGRRDQHNERARRSADLEPAAAQGGDEESADDGGGQAATRRHAGSDGDGHGQRQGDNGDR